MSSLYEEMGWVGSAGYHTADKVKGAAGHSFDPKPLRFFLEAATGFEPVDNGFADRRLTTWLCRLWSGKRDLNPRLQPWQGCTLPLSYSRLL